MVDAWLLAMLLPPSRRTEPSPPQRGTLKVGLRRDREQGALGVRRRNSSRAAQSLPSRSFRILCGGNQRPPSNSYAYLSDIKY